MRKGAGLFLFCAALLFGQQIDSNSITVTVSKDLKLPPEQVTLDIQVLSDATATLDDAQALLRSAGITGATFRAGALTLAISAPSLATFLVGFASPLVSRDFELTVPLSKLPDIAAAILKVSKPGAAGKSLSAAFSVINSFAGDATIADARRKALPDLVAAAQQQAKSIADAAGFSLGPILAFSEGPGDLSLTVKFALLRFSSAQ